MSGTSTHGRLTAAAVFAVPVSASLLGCSAQPTVGAGITQPQGSTPGPTPGAEADCPEGAAATLSEFWVAGHSDVTVDNYVTNPGPPLEEIDGVPAGFFDGLPTPCSLDTYSHRTESHQVTLLVPGAGESEAKALTGKLAADGWSESGSGGTAFVPADISSDSIGVIVMPVNAETAAALGFTNTDSLLVIQIGRSTDWGAF